MDESKLKIMARTPGLFLLAWFIAVFPHAIPAEVVSDGEAMSYLSAAADRDLPSHAMAGKGARVKIQSSGLDSARLVFRLPDGALLAARRNRTITNGRLTSWVGTFEGRPGSIAVMSHRDGETTGFLNDGEKIYEIRSGPSGDTLIYEVDQRALPPQGVPLTPEFESIKAPMLYPELRSTRDTAPLTAVATGALSAGGLVIQDIMLIYTPAARDFFGSSAIIESVLQDAVVATNQTYIDSGVDVELNVVHVAEIDFMATGDLSETLTRLRDQSDGFIDEVHTWRDIYGADLVTMISVENDPLACGLAFRPYGGFPFEDFDSFMFNVIDPPCLSSGTLAHEVAHNQGMCHDRGDSAGCDDPDTPSFYPYSWGYCATGFRTLMAVKNSCNVLRARRFSNPLIMFSGEPTGIDFDVDPLNSADAARTLNNTAVALAGFRFPDADLDGMSDDWEMDNGLDQNDSSDASADPDADALINRLEFEADSDPHNPDTDGDTFLDNVDELPRDPGESLDTDRDGIGNNADTDDDNDGIPDLQDDFPLDPRNTPPPDGSSTLSAAGLSLLLVCLFPGRRFRFRPRP